MSAYYNKNEYRNRPRQKRFSSSYRGYGLFSWRNIKVLLIAALAVFGFIQVKKLL